MDVETDCDIERVVYNKMPMYRLMHVFGHMLNVIHIKLLVIADQLSIELSHFEINLVWLPHY